MAVLLRALVNVDIATQVAEGRRGDEEEATCTVYTVAYNCGARETAVASERL
jgi:hypothetical protein